MPKTIVTLRSPAEKFTVGGPKDKWFGFTFGEQTLTFGKDPTGRQTTDYRTVPWWRVVSIDTTGAPVRELAAPAAAPEQPAGAR